MSNREFEIEQVDMLGARASRDRELGTEFPQRVETNTDLNYYDKAKKVDVKLKFEHPSSTIYEVKRRFDAVQLEQLVNSNRYLGAMKDRIKKNANRRQDALRMLAISVRENTHITAKMNERFIALQEGFDVIGIYDGYHLTPHDLKERIKSSVRFMEENGITAKRINVRMPTIIQHPDTLKQKMAVAFAETDGIALKGASFDRATRQYRVIRSFNARGEWTHMYDMANVWTGNDRTSMMHIAQLFGIDSYSLRTRKPPKNIPPLTPKRLDIRGLGNLTLEEHLTRYGHDLSCACYVCMGKTMEDMQNDYSPHERYPIFRSHLPYASNMEFAFDRQAILDQGRHLQNRLRQKEFMVQPFRHLFNEDITSRLYQPRLSI